MTEKQAKMIERIKQQIERAIEEENRKYKTDKCLKKFEVTDVGGSKVITFTTDYAQGSGATGVNGKLFIGKRGGLRGEIRAYYNFCRINSSLEEANITRWI